MTLQASDDRRLHTFEHGERLLARGAVWTLLDFQRGADCTALRLWRDDAPGRQTLLAPFDRFIRVPPQQPALVRPARWLHNARRIGAAAWPAGGLQAVVPTRVQLLPYQLEPALAVLRHGATRVLIADAVGLGKTIQAGLLLLELARSIPALRALVLTPAGLRDQWSQELARCFDLAVTAADAAWLRAAGLERPADVNPWALPGIYLASLDFVKRPEVLRPLEDVTWDLLVVDEAHACSLRSDRRAAAHAIGARADRVVLLTATPHSDDPAGFAALCSLGRVDPQDPPIVIFRRSRRDVSDAPPRRSSLIAVRPTADELRMHDLLEKYTRAVWREALARGDELARLAAVVLRKRALSSASSLALSVRRRMSLLAGEPVAAGEQLRLPLGEEDPLADDVAADVLAAPGLADAPRERRWLEAIAEAAERASRAESKLRFLRRLLRRVHEPVIVFTEYRDTLEHLRTALAAGGRELLVLHGGLTPAERSRATTRFNSGGAVLLATDAAAEGLNLHAQCRLIVHHELPWSVSRLEQRAGRVDRIGQRRRVHELGLVASSTAERVVLEPLVRRASLARASGDSQGLSAVLTESRIAEAIVGGTAPAAAPAALVPPASAAIRWLDLQHESRDEAARLSAARRAHHAASGRAGEPHDRRTLVSSMDCRGNRLTPGVILIYLLALTSPDGAPVHVEPLVLFLEKDSLSAPSRVSVHRLRGIAQAFMHPSNTEVRCRIAQAIEGALDVAIPVYRRVNAELHRRRARAASARTSAARQLVQAGLFDRRTSGTHFPAEESPGLPVGDDATFATSSRASVLGVDVSLAAVLLIERR